MNMIPTLNPFHQSSVEFLTNGSDFLSRISCRHNIAWRIALKCLLTMELDWQNNNCTDLFFEFWSIVSKNMATTPFTPTFLLAINYSIIFNMSNNFMKHLLSILRWSIQHQSLSFVIHLRFASRVAYPCSWVFNFLTLFRYQPRHWSTPNDYDQCDHIICH